MTDFLRPSILLTVLRRKSATCLSALFDFSIIQSNGNKKCVDADTNFETQNEKLDSWWFYVECSNYTQQIPAINYTIIFKDVNEEIAPNAV